MFWPNTKNDGKPFEFPEINLDEERTYLRPPQARDWLDWKRVRHEHFLDLQPFEPTWPDGCLSPEFFKRRLSRQILHWHEDKSRAFLIFLKDKDELIGGININNIVRGVAQHGSLGYWIAKSHEGKGYMSEAIRAICNHGFADMNLQRIHAACLLHNKRSKNLLLRGGFTEEGTAKKYLKIDGKWQDHLLFGRTRDQWELQIQDKSFFKKVMVK